MQGNEALQLFGITLVGATPENGKKLLLTFILVAVVLLFAGWGDACSPEHSDKPSG
jgi:hypothetical protein